MRILITGVSGLVGHELWPLLESQHELWAAGRTKSELVPSNRWRALDITDAEATDRCVAQINPDCLIHLAAISSPDTCERDPDSGYKFNSLGTRNLALASQRFDTEMLYMSTDQVFNGQKKSPYTELDAVESVNHYGRSKIWAEQFVQTLLRRFYIVRPSLVFGAKRPTFIDQVARAAKNQEKILAATDLVNSSTHARDLSAAISYLLDRHLYGTYHIANEGHCSRYELACFVADTLGVKNSFIVKSLSQDLNLPARRPGYTPIENKVWNLNGFPKLRTWQESVSSYMGKI